MSVVLLPEAATLRRWTGQTLDADGFAASKAGVTTTTIAGSFQPVTRSQLTDDLIAEGVEKVVWIDTSLYLTPRPVSVDNQTPGDEIDYNGETFRVVKTEEWRTGLANCKAYLTRRLA